MQAPRVWLLGCTRHVLTAQAHTQRTTACDLSDFQLQNFGIEFVDWQNWVGARGQAALEVAPLDHEGTTDADIPKAVPHHSARANAGNFRRGLDPHAESISSGLAVHLATRHQRHLQVHLRASSCRESAASQPDHKSDPELS